MIPGETWFPFWAFLAPKKKQGPKSPPHRAVGWVLLLKVQMSPEECPCSITSWTVAPRD